MLVRDEKLTGTEGKEEHDQHDAEKFDQVADNNLHDDFNEGAHATEDSAELEGVDPGNAHEVWEHDHAPLESGTARRLICLVLHSVAEELCILSPCLRNILKYLMTPPQIHHYISKPSHDPHPINVLPRIIKILLHNITETSIAILQHRNIMASFYLADLLENEVEAPNEHNVGVHAWILHRPVHLRESDRKAKSNVDSSMHETYCSQFRLIEFVVQDWLDKLRLEYFRLFIRILFWYVEQPLQKHAWLDSAKLEVGFGYVFVDHYALDVLFLFWFEAELYFDVVADWFGLEEV